MDQSKVTYKKGKFYHLTKEISLDEVNRMEKEYPAKIEANKKANADMPAMVTFANKNLQDTVDSIAAAKAEYNKGKTFLKTGLK